MRRSAKPTTYWRLTPADLVNVVGVPTTGDDTNTGLVSLEDELRVERFALMRYLAAAVVGFLAVGAAAVFVVAGFWSWRTLILLAALVVVGPFVLRFLVAAVVWPFECNYRRRVGQFHHGLLPPALLPDTPYWPVAVLRKLVPPVAAVAFVLLVNRMILAF